MATILIVDDSKFQRAFLKKALASDEHRFLEAENGHDGLAIARSERPDCILADLIMPKTQGLGLLEGLKENGSLIPIIVVTADIQHQVREQCLALGARTVLHKPVDPETLRQTVSDLLGGTAVNPTPLQTDALSELINIGVGHAAGMLNQMVGSPIRLRVPAVKVLHLSRLSTELGRGPNEVLSLIRQPFAGFIQGTAALVFPPQSAARLVAALTSEEPGSPDLDSVRSGTLSEVGNIVINGVMGTIANILHIRLSYGLPSYLDDSITHLFRPPGSRDDPMVVVAHTHFVIEDLDIQGTILLICEVLSFDALLTAIDSISSET